MSYVTLRWILVNLRGGTVELRLETGGCGLRREDRVCTQCCLGEVEDVEHFALRCGKLVRERAVLVNRMEEIVDGFEKQCDEEKMVLLLNGTCRDGRAGGASEKMWMRRLYVPD